MMKNRYKRAWMSAGIWLVFVTVTAVGQVHAQEDHRVKGTVHDLEGRPLNGRVTCSSSTTVISNGVFEVNPLYFPDTIRVESLGFHPVTRVVNAPGTVAIRMTPSTTQIDEVLINTGYQTISPNEINGTVALISSEMITTRTTGNILERIQGHASGLTTLVGKQETTGGTGVLVRGLGTLEGPIEPLIVLDGFIYDGDINNIDPNTVENVTLLKDAAAASIWGARAGNGVIVITTKTGRYNQRMRISIHADRSFQAPPLLSEQYRVGATTHIDLEKFLFEQGYFDQQIMSVPHGGLSPIVDLLARQRDGLISKDEFAQEMAFWSKQDARNNYLDEFYTTAHTKNYGVQLDGGSERNSYMIGVSYQDHKGSLYDISRRLNLRLNNQFRILDNLTLSVNVQFTHNFSKQGRDAYNTIRPGSRTGDYLAFRDEMGLPIPLDYQYRGRYTDSIGKDILLDWKHYPAEEYNFRDNHNDRLDLFSTVGLKYIVLPWLSLTGNFQYQNQDAQQVIYTSQESYVSRNLINQYTQHNPATNAISYVVPIGGIYRSSDATVNSFAWRGQANINHQRGAHGIKAILGMELRGSGTRSKTNGTMYGYHEDPLTYTQIDLHTRYPHFITKANTSIGASNAITRTDYRFVSFYGNFAYTYLNRYTISGSARRDGSNLFGVNTNDRWKPLWSAGVGWNISNESFYQERYIADLSLNITYGRSGNLDMTKTALPIASKGTNRESGFKTARVTALNNPELRWEQLDQLSLRLEGRSKNGRINSSLGFFKKYGSDLYGNAPYDFTTWAVASTITRNVAAMEGYGMEWDIHAIYIDKGKFKWSGTGYFNWNDNRTTAYYYDVPSTSELSRLIVEGNKINPVIGKPLYGIAAYRWAGLNTDGEPQGFLNGVPSTDYQAISRDESSIVFIGSATPRYYGSMTNQIVYGSWRLLVGIDFHLGYFVKKQYFTSAGAISGSIHKDYLDRWQNPGDELLTSVPKFVYPNSNWDGFYGTTELHTIPGDHIRLNYINLVYGINTSQWKQPFRNLELRGGIENGMLLWKKNNAGVDPNYIDGSQSKLIWSFGINAQF